MVKLVRAALSVAEPMENAMTTSDPEPSRAEIEQRAREVGLVHLPSEQLDEFARAEAYAHGLAARLSREFLLAEEPALVFRAGSE